ncbi:MAG: polysaccharide deacetylase family protein [Bacilli bacterium]|nr:polysaccharide deacetylase family protein [Bacilli bacterium]
MSSKIVNKSIKTHEKKDNKNEITNDINRKKLNVTNTLLIIIFSLTVALIISMITIPYIQFKNKDIEINYNTEFNNNDYTAKNLFKNYTKEVIVKDNINNKKIGTYEIEYKLKFGLINIIKKRKVKVIDNIKPDIKLKGNNVEYVCPNKEYIELGYSATDEYDGDLTNKVEIKNYKDNITYKVSDSSGNVSTITRNIKYEDIEKPTITLKGSDNITLYVGNKYNEDGYTATDNCDGDLTNKVKVTNNIDINTPGTYKVTYKVIDNSNNEITKERNITVKKWSIIRPSSGGNGKGIVYLTFDDGPNEGTTNIILDILKEEGVQATFFVTNYGPDYLIKREYDEGHTVALHTASHQYGIVYASVDNYFNDLNQVSNRVERITGEKSMISRFPGGSSNTVSSRYSKGIMTTLTSEVKKRGYHYFDWNVDSGDAAGASIDGVYANVINNISPNRENVVLMHDVKYTTTNALRSIIRYGKQNGYTFKKITYDTVMVTHGVNN